MRATKSRSVPAQRNLTSKIHVNCRRLATVAIPVIIISCEF